MAYSQDGTIGSPSIVLATSTVPTISSDGTTSKWTLGDQVKSSSNQTWMYCKASGAIVQYAAVTIDNAFLAKQITPTLAALANTLGVSQITFADTEYGWIAIDGTGLWCLIDGTDDVNPGVSLAVSPIAAGLLSKLTISGQQMAAGIRTLTTASGTTVTVEVILNHPHIYLTKV